MASDVRTGCEWCGLRGAPNEYHPYWVCVLVKAGVDLRSYPDLMEVMRRKHWREPNDTCHWCGGDWPCHSAALLDAYATLEAERDRLPEVLKAWRIHWDGDYWAAEHRSKRGLVAGADTLAELWTTLTDAEATYDAALAEATTEQR